MIVQGAFLRLLASALAAAVLSGCSPRAATSAPEAGGKQHPALIRPDSSGKPVNRPASSGTGATRSAPGSPQAIGTGKAGQSPLKPPVAADSEPPPTGGSLRLYYPRSELEYPFSGLLDKYPFAEKNGRDSVPGFFTVQSVTPLSITLTISAKTVNADGRALNTLVIIDQWTRLVHNHPAEGFALFRFCDGIREYISGREAIIRGFLPLDNTTIRIKLGSPDTLALDRLRTGRTLPASLRAGSYAREAAKDNGDSIVSNTRTAGASPHVDFAVVKRGGDGNPLLSFSLGRYDAVALWNTQDLDYARRTLLKKGAACLPIGSDRYFVACRLPDSAERLFLRSILVPATLLKDVVKAEGVPINAVESDSSAPPGSPLATAISSPPMAAGPIKIWYREDDAISKIIAEKLLAACMAAGMSGKAIPLEPRNYELMLAGDGQGCIIGWVGEGVTTCRSDKLRFSSMFFPDAAGESDRIRENLEIPLFSANWFLLARSNVGLWNGKISGIYSKRD